MGDILSFNNKRQILNDQIYILYKLLQTLSSYNRQMLDILMSAFSGVWCDVLIRFILLHWNYDYYYNHYYFAGLYLEWKWILNLWYITIADFKYNLFSVNIHEIPTLKNKIKMLLIYTSQSHTYHYTLPVTFIKFNKHL